VNRRLLAAVAIAVVAVSTRPLPVGAATSASFASPNATTSSIDARVRIQQITAAYPGTTMTLTVSVAQGTNPASDPGWGPQQFTGVEFLIESPSARFIAAAGTNSSHQLIAVVLDSNANVLCDPAHGTQATYDGTSSYSISFPAACISSPSGAVFRAAVLYQPQGSTTLFQDSEPKFAACCQVGNTSSGTAGISGVVRLAGPSRMETSVAISRSSYLIGGSATSAVLVDASSFADAVVAAPLAVQKHGPVLLTLPNNLDAGVAAELTRILAPGATVYLIGGTNVISTGVETAVAALGFTPLRVAGKDRFGTAVAVARSLTTVKNFLEATGLDFPDALSAAAAAAASGSAVLLTNGTTVDAATASFINGNLTVGRYAIGKAAATADPATTTTDLVGSDRYATAVLVAQKFFSAPTEAGVASGQDFPDALAGSAHIAAAGGPLLLTDPSTLSSATQSYIAGQSKVTEAFVYGGPIAISNAVSTALASALTGHM
jgi:hypothetical protein